MPRKDESFQSDFIALLESLIRSDFEQVKQNFYQYLSSKIKETEISPCLHNVLFRKLVYDKDLEYSCSLFHYDYFNKFYKAPSFSDGELKQIVMIGRCGCGKTATIAEMSKNYAIVYLKLLRHNLSDLDIPLWMRDFREVPTNTLVSKV